MSPPRSTTAGWTAAELGADPSWTLKADGQLEAGIGALLAWAGSRPDPEENLAASGWDDAGAWGGELFRRWGRPLEEQLARGRGVARVTGLRNLEDRELGQVFLAIGLGLGRPDRTYGLLYRVSDSGGSHLDRAIPVSQTRAGTGMHTDSSQRAIHPRWVGLACVRPAASGGASGVASARAVHDHLLDTHPATVARLRQCFLRDLVTPGAARDRQTIRANAFPIFAGSLADPTLRYMRYWIEKGHQEAGEPLGPAALADLDRLDAALNSTRFRHEFQLDPGDLLFLDNHRVAHDRTAYVDGPTSSRLMLRLWLNDTGGVPEGEG